MKTYIALLRGINVGGHRKMKMADLKTMLHKMGFQDVYTYIQSGNVVFKSSETSTVYLEETIKVTIAKTFGFDVPVLVKTFDKLNTIFKENPFTEASDIENKRVYFALLNEPPKRAFKIEFQGENFPGEQFLVTDDCVYLNYAIGAGKTKLTNNLIERKLRVSATSRNYRTLAKLLEISNELC